MPYDQFTKRLASITIQKRAYFSIPIRGLVLLFIFFITIIGKPQDVSCEMLTSTDGLSQSTVNCLLQDDDDLLWIGTQDGLNLYDGYSFTWFQNQPGDSTSLSDNYILSMCQTHDGFIWMGTMSGGLNRFDKKTLSFKRFQKDPVKINTISDNTIWCVSSDHEGNIWAGTNTGLNKYDTHNERFTHFTNDSTNNGLQSNMIISLLNDSKNNLWIGTNKGFALFDIKQESFIKVGVSENGNNFSQLAIWSASENNQGQILVGTNHGLWKLDDRDQSLERILIPDISSTIWSINAFDSDKLWIGTRQGLYSYSFATNQSSKLECISANQEIISKNNTWCILHDKSGLFWVGTDEGLLKIKPDNGSFKTLDSNKENELFLSGPSVNSILVDKQNTLWIGTDGSGLNRLDNEKTNFKVYKSNPTLMDGLSSNRIWSLLEDRDGLIWIGTYGGGLNTFDKNTQLFKTFIPDNSNNCISNTRVLVLFEDKNGIIWIGTRGGGLNSYDKKTGRFNVYKHDPNDSTSLSSNTVLSINEEKNGNLWIGTYKGGLGCFNPKGRSFINYCSNEKNGCISNNNVWTILFDSQDNIWVGTQGGLNWADLKNNGDLFFHHLTTQHGLPSNVIFGLQQDENENIWMSTFRGIGILKKENRSKLNDNKERLNEFMPDPFDPLIKTFTVSDGIHGNEFNQGSHNQAKDGHIYFGGLLGMTYFHPDSVQTSNFDPKVMLTGFKIFNKDVGILKNPSLNEGSIELIDQKYYIPKKINYLDELILSYRESVFSFSYASLDYSNPDENQYAFIMEGFESDWNFVGNQTSATYTNLDPGSYTFRVMATNADEKWSIHEARISITITPPFWKTSWFMTLLIVTIVLIIVLIVLQILRLQKKKAEAEKEKIELQLKTIKNQIDPHFAFNAMNMIGSLVYKNDPDMVYDYFSRFAQLIRSTLKDSEKIARTLSEELEFVKNYVEIQRTRFKDKFDFDLKVGHQVELETQVPKMIIQTFAENAIKHGLMHKTGKGLLEINVHQEKNYLYISVKDDGIGRKKAAAFNKSSTKKGMGIIRQILELYSKIFKYKIHQEIIDLTDNTGKASGTEVKLTIIK